MKDINYVNCMKIKCEQCKQYNYCFRYRKDKSGKYKEYKKTNYKNNKNIAKL